MESMYDLGIIGAGPAGYVAAERAADNGLSVVLFEKNEVGGVCLNTGCIPTKTLLHSAKVFNTVKESSLYGIEAGDPSFDLGKIISRKNKVVKVLTKGVESALKSRKVTLVKGECFIQGSGDEGITLSVDDEQYECRDILIATGSQPFIPPIEGADSENVLTSTQLLDIESMPASLVIIGGGFIGLEFASFFATLGTAVTVIEMMDEIAPGMDREMAGMLRKDLSKQGIIFSLGSKVTKIEGDNVICEGKDSEESFSGEKILMCVGRKPVIEGFGLENLPVEVKNGAVSVDERCRTNHPHVYAAGDVNGRSMLAHTATREAEVAVNVISGIEDHMRYIAVPGVAYTEPEAASVGYTEEALNQEKKLYDVLKLPMGYSGRFKAEFERKNGMCKILVGKKHREILGVHMIGGGCSEMIYGASLMIETELRTKDVKEIIFPHPTVSEIIRETLLTDH